MSGHQQNLAAARRGESPFVAHIPACIRSKQKLLRILAEQLKLPAYFGYNWDALEECLRDLSWFPAGTIELRHRDIPLPPGSEDQRVYLQILQSAAEFWAESGQRRFVSVFPPEIQSELPSLPA